MYLVVFDQKVLFIAKVFDNISVAGVFVDIQDQSFDGRIAFHERA